jgi:hypothetical protein
MEVFVMMSRPWPILPHMLKNGAQQERGIHLEAKKQ